VTYPFREYDGNSPALINPRLDFMAPEYYTTKSYDSQSDMFSLGMLIYALYNRGRTLYECHDNYSAFIKMCDDLKVLTTAKLSALPMEVREHVKMLLSLRPELRPDAGQFSKVSNIISEHSEIRPTNLGAIFRRCGNKNIGIPGFLVSSGQHSTIDVL
jgi:SCY1-like protein 2